MAPSPQPRLGSALRCLPGSASSRCPAAGDRALNQDVGAAAGPEAQPAPGAVAVHSGARAKPWPWMSMVLSLLPATLASVGRGLGGAEIGAAGSGFYSSCL